MGDGALTVVPQDLRDAAALLSSFSPTLKELAQQLEAASESAPDVGNVAAAAQYQHGDWACAQTRFEDLRATAEKQHDETANKLNESAEHYESNDTTNAQNLTLHPREGGR
ncbi:hypothetical protein Srot_1904 [Segniliparus rotundus DSM 44985]|uniref:Uncharacterized protein n=1 Tax=Segniliparus rotundus (strain ATCC BAA-972 / CDC 1076 / CIP 108378 / DSM 44985 / JCM 13578) TaxID=640132 RepID=D6Z8T3_SEGRD|nr:type VII secretion target [Segniliparus rotundus]ADG98363.1 hypothetical protein Srot_1904 [Segniliparus rotundus DSM 44985]